MAQELPVRPLTEAERGEAACMLARSFDDEPLFSWFLPGAAKRAAWLDWFHRRVFNETRPLGGAVTLAGVGALVGAALYYPPGRWPPTRTRALAAWPVPPSLPTWRLVRMGLHVEARIHALHPREPHLYLYVLGVDPAQKGKGHGGALLRHVVDAADVAGVPAHLETANPSNLTLYRKFGFEVQAEVTTHGGPTCWVMTRAKRSPTGAFSSPG